MEWRENVMTNSLDIKGKSINALASWYADNGIYVNRRYQRKLVWSLEDKKLYIDSLWRDIPVPAIILNECNDEKSTRYEIIDGLQRLNALFSFLLNEFPIRINGKEYYFDMTACPAIQRIKTTLGIEQRIPTVENRECVRFTEKELPLIIAVTDKFGVKGEENVLDKVDEIFLRINSTGKQLSSQDLRQASACDDFSNTVSKLACLARGDNSDSAIILLQDMPKISINSSGLNYGIKVAHTLWRKHDIILSKNLRDSTDEAIIAKILIEYLRCWTRPSSEMLDRFYKEDGKNKLVIDKINEIGEDSLRYKFTKALGDFDRIFSTGGASFSKILFKKEKVSNKDNVFIIFLLCLLELSDEGYQITDYAKIAHDLNAYGDSTLAFMQKSYVSVKQWEDAKETVKEFLCKRMKKCTPRVNTSTEFEIASRLSKSSIEVQMTEYKLTLRGTNNKIWIEKLHEIIRTLTAMNNTNNNEEGLVIVGVANSEEAAMKWEKTYEEQAFKFSNWYVTGVGNEAVDLYHGIEGYMQALKDKIKQEPISVEMCEMILANMESVWFDNKQLLLFRCKKLGEEQPYDGKLYTRNVSSTEMKQVV